MRISLGDRYIGDEIDGKCWKEKEKGMNMGRDFPRLSWRINIQIFGFVSVNIGSV